MEGETQSVFELAAVFLEWFHWKLKKRERQFRNLDAYDLQDVLGAIAKHTDKAPPYSRRTDWDEPAKQIYYIDSSGAFDLYIQDVSAGLIREDARQVWRWRHSFVHRFLMESR